MYQAKVNNTQKYEDSQGSHVVATGKLVLIEDENWLEPRECIVTNGEDYLLRFPEWSDFWNPVKPIIISETEEIEEGDTLYNSRTGDILRTWMNDRVNKWWYKVLALPEHFSDKHLQAIVDGKMEDGDEVLVKCEILEEPVDDGNYDKYKVQQIHLDQQNHITLFPAKHSLGEAAKKACKIRVNKGFHWKAIVTTNLGVEIFEEGFKDGFAKGAEWAKKNCTENLS